MNPALKWCALILSGACTLAQPQVLYTGAAVSNGVSHLVASGATKTTDQTVDTALMVTGEVKTMLKLTLADLETMPATTVNAKDHDGSTANYAGVSLHSILLRAGIPQGELLRGDALQLCVLVKAADGYKVAFTLAELDPLFTDKMVLLAYRRDGNPLDARAGPLRLVIPDEKRQSRWVRKVTELEIVRVNDAAKHQ